MAEKLQIDNPENSSMHYQTHYVIQTLNPPDSLPKVYPYNYTQANKTYDGITKDIYVSQKKAKPYEKYKFPLVLKIMFASIAACSLVIFRKNIASLFKKVK